MKVRKIRKVKKPRPCPAERHHLVLDNMALVSHLVTAHERRIPTLARFDWEDRFQQALVSCLRSLPDFDPAISSIGTRLGWAVYGSQSDMLRVAGNQNNLGAVASLDAFEDADGKPLVLAEMAAPIPPCPLEAEDNATYARRVCEAAFRCIPWRQAWAVRLVWLHGLACTQAGLMMGERWYDVRNLVREGLEGMRGVIRAREEAA